MNKKLASIITILLLGYLITVFCQLTISKNVMRIDEVYNKYCTGYEESCGCEVGEYGIVEKGYPFVSGRDDKYPCARDATVEERSVTDFERSNSIGFIANNVFWSSMIFMLVKLSSKLRIKK